MKKVVAILTIALAMIAMASCKKANSLAGTTWKCVVSAENDGDAYSINSSFSFQETTFTFTFDATGPGAPPSQSANGTYTYNAPTVTMKIGTKELTANINGSILTVNDPDLGQLEYKKQLK